MPEDAKIPDEAFCSECMYLLPDYPDIRSRLAARGFSHERMDMAWCRCAQRAEAARIEDAQRVHEANFPRADGLRVFETFESREGTERAVGAARTFAGNKLTPGLVLIGGTGSGKTHLLEAIGRVTLSNGGTVRYEMVKDLLERLRATNAYESGEETHEVLSYYQGVGVLLLDDLGVERGNPYAVEQVTAMVDYRYRHGLAFVVATNKTKDQVAEHMGDRLSDRLWDDRSGRVTQVYLTAESYRTEGAG
ncbi:DNA replication protein [uncultured Mediterranean phage]|nr:DNA replication protein [uncultured Mediterranean phage]